MEFTIEDVKAWIDCCRDAGKRVWLDSNFAISLTRIYMKGLVETYGRGESVLNPRRGTAPVSAFGAEEVAWSTVLEVQEWIKTTSKEYGYDFNHKMQFIKYVRETVRFRLMDKVSNRRHEKPLPTLVSKEGDEQIDFLEIIEDPVAVDEFQKILHQEDLKNYENQAKSLMDVFIESRFASRAIRNRLNLLFQCSGALGALGVLIFIEKKLFHMDFQAKARDVLGKNFNQNTWNSYNFRLKDAWLKFLESEEGKPLNERFKECREWLKEIIS